MSSRLSITLGIAFLILAGCVKPDKPVTVPVVQTLPCPADAPEKIKLSDHKYQAPEEVFALQESWLRAVNEVYDLREGVRAWREEHEYCKEELSL